MNNNPLKSFQNLHYQFLPHATQADMLANKQKKKILLQFLP